METHDVWEAPIEDLGNRIIVENPNGSRYIGDPDPYPTRVRPRSEPSTITRSVRPRTNLYPQQWNSSGARAFRALGAARVAGPVAVAGSIVRSILGRGYNALSTESQFRQMRNILNNNRSSNTMSVVPYSASDMDTGSVYGHGLSAASALPMNHFSRSRRKLGRKKRLSAKFLKQLQPFAVYRFQGLTNFYDPVSVNNGTYGFAPLNIQLKYLNQDNAYTCELPIWPVSDGGVASFKLNVSATYLPMYCYNLSALPCGFVKSNNQSLFSGFGRSIPMYQLVKKTLVLTTPHNGTTYTKRQEFYCWDPVRGSQNNGLGAGSNRTDAPAGFLSTISPSVNTPLTDFARLEESKFAPQTQAPMYTHDYSDIRINFVGDRTRNTCFKVSIVNFLREEIQPARMWALDSDVDASNLQVRYAKIINKDYGDVQQMEGTHPGSGSTSTTIPIAVLKLNQNMSGGQVTNAQGLVIPQFLSGVAQNPEENIDIESCTSFWESYWSNRMGHPLAYSKNRAPHKKYMNVQYSECIAMAPVSTNDPQATEARRHLHKVFKRFNKVIDTSTPTAYGDTSLHVAPIGGIPGTASAFEDQGAFMTTGYSTKAGWLNSHLYGNNRARDDWLLIESDNCYQGIPTLTYAPNSTATPVDGARLPFGFGGLDVTMPCYTPGSQISTNGSFDISIRSKYHLVNASNS